MSQDIFKGKWHQLKGAVIEQWGKLSQSDVDRIDGSREKLAGAIQERYGRTKEDAASEVEEWVNGLARKFKPDKK